MSSESPLQNHEKSRQPENAVKKNTPFLEPIKALFDRDHFRVDPQRAHDYLYLNNRSETKFDADMRIPLGKNDEMNYGGRVLGGVSDRPIGDYQEMLFPDVFKKSVPTNEGYSVEGFLREQPLLDAPEPVLGGYEGAFKPGNVVLDIASGEAVADMQLALNFPETTFIGGDILYQKKRKIFLDRPGLQLTQLDWRSLGGIPDASIDVILSVQGIGRWGLRGEGEFDISEENGFKIIRALNRVSKPGTILRLDGKNEFFYQHLKSDWDISERDDVFIAQRKRL